MEKFIKNIIVNAGKILMENFRSAQRVDKKENAGYVTEADNMSEEFIIESILKEYNGHGILAEESGNQGIECAYKWIIDPLDGTTNYVHGLPWFCVSIACEFEGDIIVGGVYNPAIDELFFAELNKGAYLNNKKITVSQTGKLCDSLLATGFYYNKGRKLESAVKKFGIIKEKALSVRRIGAAAIDLAYTAAGRFDGYWEKDLSPWDMAAGLLIVKEAGGVISNFDGTGSTVYDKEIIASNGLIHKEMSDILKY